MDDFENTFAQTRSAARNSGWVGWAGEVVQYPLQTRADCTESSRSISISVATDSASGELAHLHAGSVWNSAVRLAQLIECGLIGQRLAGKVVLELGAGAALPSQVLLAGAALQGGPVAEPLGLVISDFPSPGLLGNIEDMLQRNSAVLHKEFCLGSPRLSVIGHAWGSDSSQLLEVSQAVSGETGFGVVLLADCLWNTTSHEDLLQTLLAVLHPRGEIWMAHCHHWPGHEEADQRFFRRARELGFRYEEVAEASRARMQQLFSGKLQEVLVHRLWHDQQRVTTVADETGAKQLN